MPRPDEGMIHAWLDGELSAEEAERVSKFAAEDPEWAAAVAEARGLVAASSRIVSALDVIPGGVMPAGTRAAGAPASGSRSSAVPRSRSMVRPWMRMAAGVVLVVGTATVVWTRTANAPQPGELQLAERTEETPSGAPAAQAAADEAAEALRGIGNDAVATQSKMAGARQEVAANAPPPARAGNEVKKSAVGETVAREAIMDSAARLNANVAGAGVAAPSSVREADALKRAESERTLAGARVAVTEPSAAPAAAAAAPTAKAPATQALAPTPKAAADFRERRADQAAEATAAGRAAVGAITGGAAPRDAAALKSAASADAAAPALLDGCWVAATAGKPDTTLRAPRVAREAGDTLVLVVAADGRTATVRREGTDVLRGETRFGTATAVVFVGTRVACPR